MLVRGEQVRRMLELLREAKEIGPGPEQTLHLVTGIHGIVGAAMTTVAVARRIGESCWTKLEEEVSTPVDPNVRKIIDALRTNTHVTRTLGELKRRLQRSSLTTARRRELVSDEDWYRSTSFNALHRVCGFDDHVYSLRAVGDGRVEGIAVRRALGDRPFDEEDRNLLELFHEEIARLDRLEKAGPDEPRLAPREREVLEHLLRGASEKQVAFDLKLSPHTVHSYAKSIYSAYRVSSRAELLVRCLAA